MSKHVCCGCGGLCDSGEPCPMAYSCACQRTFENYLRALDATDRIATIASESFGPFPVQSLEDNLTAIEAGIFALRQRAEAAEKERDAYRADAATAWGERDGAVSIASQLDRDLADCRRVAGMLAEAARGLESWINSDAVRGMGVFAHAHGWRLDDAYEKQGKPAWDAFNAALAAYDAATGPTP